jgi:glycerol-3-phosphate dehydrogenase (NAD(P)+)
MSAHVDVIGAGAWGTALAIQAALAGNRVSLWARSPDPMLPDGSLKRLPGIVLPEAVTLVRDLPTRADAVLLAVPMQHLRSVAGSLRARAPLIACCKGLERTSQLLPLELLAQLHPDLPLGVLSGPNFAAEIARGLPAAAVLACTDAGLASGLTFLLATENFRLYASDDPTGVQVGGAAKNVIAIAAGAAIGAGLGENARAALITRGVAELGRLIVGLGGKPATASGLSGLGDLVLTCTGSASRNYGLGVALGGGESLQSILAARTTVAEGVETAPALASRAASLGVAVPVIEAVSLLLTGTIDLQQARIRLLARPLRME